MKVGDWVRVNATYQVGTIVGSGYGDELSIVTIPPMLGMMGQSLFVSAAGVTAIPVQSGSPPDLVWVVGGARLAKAKALAARPGTKGEGEAAKAAVERLKQRRQ